MRSFATNGSGRYIASVLLLLALPLSACSNVDRAVATSPVPDDFHLRHPIVLANERQTLDVFLVGANGRMDSRQKGDVEDFAQDYRTHGQGRIRALVPRGAVDPVAADATLGSVRQALVRAGLRDTIEVGSYRVADATLASPVRLSFIKLQAKGATRCGEWPEDLASASSVEGWENRSYYNFGCSTQQTLAAQLDDPRDLVRPRVEDPSDVQMRTRAIGDIRGAPDARQGTNPSTAWDAVRPISVLGGN